MEATAPGTGRSVVVVDFLRFDARPKLADVLRDHTDRPLFRLDPVADLVRGGEVPALPEQASAFAKVIAEQAGDIAVIAGYCNAAALTMLIAAQLHGIGTRPDIILVDPSWPTASRVEAEFAALRRSLGGTPSPAARAGGPDLAEMTATLRADLAQMLREEESPEEEIELMAAALVPRYRAWLGLLLASAATRLPEPGGTLRLVCGRDLDLPAHLGHLGATATRVDVDPAALLAAGSPALGVLGDLIRAA